VSTSCSTLHVPYSLDAEPDIDARLRSWLASALRRSLRCVTLARGLKDGREAIAADVAASNAAIASRRSDPRLNNGHVRSRISSIIASGYQAGARPISAAPCRTNGCACPPCRPRPSARTRRRRPFALLARTCGTGRSMPQSTSAG